MFQKLTLIGVLIIFVLRVFIIQAEFQQLTIPKESDNKKISSHIQHHDKIVMSQNISGRIYSLSEMSDNTLWVIN